LTDELKSKQTPQEQARVLKNVKEHYKVSDKNMKKLIKELEDKDIIKKVVIKEEKGQLIFETPRFPSDIQIDLVGRIPQMKGVGEMVGVTKAAEQILKPKDVKVLEKIKPSELPGVKKKVKLATTPLLTISQMEAQIQKERQRQKQRQVLLLKQPQVIRARARQTLRVSSLLRTGLRVTPKIQPRYRPSIPRIIKPQPKPKKPRRIIPIPKLKPSKEKIFKKIPKKLEYLIPEVKRYGVWRPISEPKPRRKAIRIGIKELRKTLAASLRLRKPSGEIVPFAKETPEFRLGVGKPTVLVQRARRRLKAREEVAEIIRARKGIKFI